MLFEQADQYLAFAGNRLPSWKYRRLRLIGYVEDGAQETEAHTCIGLKLRAQGDDNADKKHLEWVAQNGDRRVFEYTLARALNLQDSLALLIPSGVKISRKFQLLAFACLLSVAS